MRTTLTTWWPIVAAGATVLAAVIVIYPLSALAADHPSVCIRRAELSRLRDKTLVPGIPSEIWKEVRAAAELAVAEPIVTLDRKTEHELGATWNARAAARNMELLSLAYLVTLEERFADCAVKTALAAASVPSWIDRDLAGKLPVSGEQDVDKEAGPFNGTDTMAGDLARGIGFVYDWLYDYLSPADRVRLRAAAIEKGIRPALGDMAAGIWWAEKWHSRGAVTMSGVGVAAVSFIDDEPEASRWISVAKRWIAGYLSRQGRDGGCTGGVADWIDGVGSALVFAEALRTRLNDADIYRQPYLRKTLEFALFTTMPDKLGVVNFGRSSYDTAYRATWLTWRLASQYRHSVAQWNATRIWRVNRIRPGGERPYRDWRSSHWDFVWFDPTVDARDPLGYAPSKHFRGIDWAIFRSGWGDKDVLAAIHSGGPDGNNVILSAYGRPLLVDNPGLEPGAYNCVFINSKGPSVPTGGSSSILEFRQERGYDYVLADAGRAYGQDVGRVHRHILFVKQPAYVVVIDDIATEQPARIEQRWHTVGRIDPGDSFATLRNNKVTLRVESYVLDGQPVEFDVGGDKSADGPYLRVHSPQPTSQYISVAVFTPGLSRSRSYHPRVEGDAGRFTVKLKRSQWLDTIECERKGYRLAVSANFEPALKLPAVRERDTRLGVEMPGRPEPRLLPR